MDGAEKAIVIIIVASMLMMGVVAYTAEHFRQVCFTAAGANPVAIKACR